MKSSRRGSCGSFSGLMPFALLLWLMVISPWCVAQEQPNLTQGLMHYWSFDRADENGMRDGAGDIPLTAPKRSGDWLVDGVAGQAVDIPGQGTLSLDGMVRNISPANLTVACWIRPETTTHTNATRTILTFGNRIAAPETSWMLQLSEGKLSLVAGPQFVRSPDVVPQGRWVHVAAVIFVPESATDSAARMVRFYVDGREVATGSVSLVPQAGLVLVGNSVRGGSETLGGQVDELAIWDRALSPSDIAALHRLGTEGKPLSAVVTTRPTVSIQAERAPDGGSEGVLVLARDTDRGTLRVPMSCRGLGIAGTDYAPISTIQNFPEGVREIRIPVMRLRGSVAISRDDVMATLEPGIMYTVSPAAPSARVWLTPNWPTPPPDRPRKIFAHYMACYPVAAAATSYHREFDAHKVRHDGKGQFDRGGDRWRNWPLVPDGMKLSLEQSADLEIRRALRGGIDGFAIDAWAGGQGAKDMFVALLKVARDKDYPFEITICLDPGTISQQSMEESLAWIMKEHGQNPKLARRDGKPLIFGYLSGFIGFNYGAAALKQLPEFADKERKELIRNRDLRTTKAGWKRMVEAHRALEMAAGTALYIHYCMGEFFYPGDFGATGEELMLQAAGFMAGEFGAVGQFLATGKPTHRMAEVVRASGAEWSEPMIYQYENLYWGGNIIPRGSSILRSCWEAARNNQSTLIQFVTWNDYTENTHLAPGYETRYAVLDLNRYLIDWWKAGREPTPQRDKLYLFFRKYPVDAKIFPFQPNQKESDGVIEVLTILTQPGRVQLTGRGEAWDAPAGLSWKHFPVTAGPLSARVQRGDQVVLKLDSPEPITDRPFRQINSLGAISSECLRQWHEDFGNVPPKPVLRGEYADDDGDGLPNWFEMYWFGKFLDWNTATKSDPNAIGADGKSLLQHYLDQTDPTRGAARGETQKTSDGGQS